MVRRSSALLSCAVLLGCIVPGAVGFAADETALDLNTSDVVRHALEQQSGKRVKVKLLSGQDVDGKVQKVGAQAVTLVELGGMDFFDATVRIDQIAAVIVKARGK